MARSFTTAQLDLLQSPGIRGRLLTTWWLDGGPYFFCDDVDDVSDGTNTYIGASLLAVCASINSSAPYAAEPVQLTLDGTRMEEVGFTDPAGIFRDIFSMDLHNKRVDFAIGLSYPDVQQITLVIPVYAGRINYAKVTYPKINFTPEEVGKPNPGNLEFYFDSLATRYSRIMGRTRSQVDHMTVDSTDNFFKFCVESAIDTQLFWGSKSPRPDEFTPWVQYHQYISYIRSKV